MIVYLLLYLELVYYSFADKAYTQDHNLKHHMQSVHEGLRLFKCDSCDKDYTTRQGLKHHVKVIDSFSIIYLGYYLESHNKEQIFIHLIFPLFRLCI